MSLRVLISRKYSNNDEKNQIFHDVLNQKYHIFLMVFHWNLVVLMLLFCFHLSLYSFTTFFSFSQPQNNEPIKFNFKLNNFYFHLDLKYTDTLLF